MTSQTITLSLEASRIEAAGCAKLRAAIASAKTGRITTTVIVDGEAAAEICPPGQDRAADALSLLVATELVATELVKIVATLDEPGVPIAIRAEHAKAALRRFRQRIIASGQPGGVSRPGSSGRPEPDMADRLGRIIGTLLEQGALSGFSAGIPFNTGYEPDTIAHWLRTGETP